MRRHPKAIAAAISALLLLTLALGVTFAAATVPTVTVDPASSVSYTSAHVAGKVNPENQDTNYFFQYSANPEAEGWGSGAYQGPLAAGAGETAVSDDLTGLKPETEYFVRLIAENADGQVVSAEPYPAFTTDPVGTPSVSIDTPTSVTGSSAHFSGTINPNAPEAAPTSAAVEAGFKVDWRFECTPECPGLTGGTIPADNASHTVSVDATGLTPGVSYEVTLVASNSSGPVSAGPESFAALEVAPVIESTSASPSYTEATLLGRFNPGGAATTYHFDYGPTSAYGQRTPEKIVPASAKPQAVSAAVLGLTAGATYHFRLVIANSVDGEVGVDHVLTTRVPATAESCANHAIREQQLSTFLGDCRAYEQVSPVDKGGASMQTVLNPYQASASGDSVVYNASGAFAGAQTALFATNYLGTRSESGWASSAISVPQKNQVTVPIFTDTERVSEDLSHAVVVSDRALAPGAVAGNYNVYLENLHTKSLTLIFKTVQQPEMFQLGSAVVGGTPDFDHVLIADTLALTPDAINNGNQKLYEFTNGQLRLVSYVPGSPEDTVSPDYVALGSEDLSDAISDDGSRIFFTLQSGYFGAGELGVYMRVDGDHTVAISKSQRTGDGPGVKNGEFGGASADGSVVFFTSTDPLTDQSTGPSLYRYDIVSESLTDIAAPVGAAGGGYIDPDPEGDSAFFVSGSSVYYWRQGQLDLVASGLSGRVNDNSLEYGFVASPNGKHLAFLDNASLTGFDNINEGKCRDIYRPVPCQQLYRYDVGPGQLECVSCRSDGVLPQGHTFFGFGNQTKPPQAVTDSGRIFFTSPDRLSIDDTNGVDDVYEAFEGRVSLISGGKSSRNSLFATASASGDDVFFTTDQQLVGQDDDSLVDLYDARVGGGLAGQNRVPADPPCSGEDCQAMPSRSPATSKPGSASVLGGGRSGSSRKSGSRCRQLERQAQGVSKAAGKLKREASRASGRKAKSLNRASQTQVQHAAELRRKAKSCKGGVA